MSTNLWRLTFVACLLAGAASCGGGSSETASAPQNPMQSIPGYSADSPTSPTAPNAPSAPAPGAAGAATPAVAMTEEQADEMMLSQEERDARQIRIACQQDLKTGNGQQMFQARFNKIAPFLSELKVSTQPGQPIWNSVTLNAHRERFDVVRFRSPLGQGADMAWCFVAPKSMGSWYITPSQGEMEGFHTYTREFNLIVPGTDAPTENVVTFQPLTGAAILPGVDYYLWFNIGDEEVRELDIAVTLLPPGTTVSDFSSEAIARTMGIDYKLPEFDASADGRRKALAQARSLYERNATESEAFRRSLWQVAAQLPTLEVGRDGKVNWETIELEAADGGFTAFRLASPLGGPADLLGAIVEPRPSSVVWNLMGRDFDPELKTASLDIDLKLPNVSLPAENLTYLFRCSDGQIEAGQEYILWLAGVETEFPPQIALHSAPVGSIPAKAGAGELARSIGLEYPAVHSPERLKTTLATCYEWAKQYGVDYSEIRLAMQSAAKSLPEVKAVTDGPIVWNRVPIGGDGIGFAAVRCDWPLANSGDLYACFGDLMKLDAQVSTSNMAYASARFVTELRGTFKDADWSAGATGYCLMKALPQQQSVIWFLTRKEFRENDSPTEVQVAFRAAPWTIDLTKTYNASDVHKLMGLHSRRPFNTAGSILANQHEADVAAIAFSKDGKQLASLDIAGQTQIWNVAEMKPGPKLMLNVPRRGKSIAFSANGERLLAGFGDPVGLTSWKATGGAAGAERKFADGAGGATALSPDGALLAVAKSAEIILDGSDAGRIIVWDMKKSAEVREISAPGFVFEKLLLGEGALVAAGSHYEDGPLGPQPRAAILLFDPKTGQSGGRLITQAGRFTDIAVSPDGNLLAFVGEGDVINFYRFEAGDMAPQINAVRFPRSVAFSADGASLACGCQDGSVQVWDMASRKLLWEGHADQNSVECVAFSPDGNWLASSGRDGAVRLWNRKQPGIESSVNSIGMKFVSIPSGEATLGTQTYYEDGSRYVGKDHTDERPRHNVSLSRSFSLGAHEVTVGQFRDFVDATGYQTTAESNGKGGEHYIPSLRNYQHRPEFTWRSPGFTQGDDHPVVHVTYDDAVAFCAWLSAKEGKKYRLPTEAEWEYASRAGSDNIYSFTDDFRIMTHLANSADGGLNEALGMQFPVAVDANDGHGFTAPVGSYPPNAFGVFDMLGNVFEWVHDWYDPGYYSIAPPNDPQGPDKGTMRVQRGGSFLTHLDHARHGARDFDKPDKPQSWVGFRVVSEN